MTCAVLAQHLRARTLAAPIEHPYRTLQADVIDRPDVGATQSEDQEHFRGPASDPARWRRLDDEAVIAELSDVRGIGRWTAEMFLIFSLRRPDVWPVDDIGLQRAVGIHYLGGVRPTPHLVRDHGQRHAPWRTVATWYLWRSLDPMVVQY